MASSTNKSRVALNFGIGTEIKNNRRLAGFEFLEQLVRTDSRHAQFLQQPVPLIELVAEVNCEEANNHRHSAGAETAQRGNHLVQLPAEHGANENEASGVDQ